MAAAFDADAAAARGQAVGDGTPVHLTIPTDNPWVPLRILGLGKADGELVEADVYLLTDEKPAMLPNPGAAFESGGLILDHSAPASDLLLADLRSDVGMEWVPESAWLTKVVVESDAGDLPSTWPSTPRERGSRRRPTPASRRSAGPGAEAPVALYLLLAAVVAISVPVLLERRGNGVAPRTPPLAGA